MDNKLEEKEEPVVKIGIYDRYLSTGGGGERYSCKMAEILSKQPGFKVELVSDLFADIKKIQSRLNLDLEMVSLKIFPFLSEDYAAKITGVYDLFINATYLSSLGGHGRKNIYLCYFPTAFDVDFNLIHRLLLIFFRLPAILLYRIADRICSGYSDVEVLDGIYDIKRFMLGRGVWSGGKLSIKYSSGTKYISIGLKNPAGTGITNMKCVLNLYEIEQGGFRKNSARAESQNLKAVVFSKELSIAEGSRITETIIPPEIQDNAKAYLLEIESDTFISDSTVSGSGDSRTLGVAVYNQQKINPFKKALLKLLGFIPLFLVTYPRDLKFLKTYERIIAISEYSKKWIEKLWKCQSDILFPPVDTNSFYAAEKKKLIISVGRFFPQHHNKKQLELAKNFIEMYKSEGAEMSGYRLVLAGGVENKKEHLEYVEKIRKISRGYPVDIMTNIKWDILRNLFSEALIFWHASGMGEDENRHPEKFEHFGITTVEAMASGAIPVVINKGGQPEIIQDGQNGFLFDTWEDMKRITLDICKSYNNGKNDFDAISRNAIDSAQKFSGENFSSHLLKIVGTLLKNTGPTSEPGKEGNAEK
ncbi:MAG: glycosyltransferase [Actinobacteria bacterium]|nr:glycosyltransferase [Actinomycetota bacterium]